MSRTDTRDAPGARSETVRSFRSHPSSLAAIRALVRTSTSVDERITADLTLAVSEAATNAVLHSGGSVVRISVAAVRGCLVVTVEDDGVFRYGGRPLDDGGGRGMAIIRALVDEVSIRKGTPERRGTRVRMVKCSTS